MSGTHNHTRHVGETLLLRVMILTGLFTAVEIVGGWYSGSLALLADAGHMFTDTAALALAYGAFRASHLPADNRRSYGYARFQVLAAFLNGLFLVGVFVWLLWEALGRLGNPPQIKSGEMFLVALAGLVVNLIAFWLLYGNSKTNLNLKAAFLHVALDLFGSISTVTAAGVIYFTGFVLIDPLLTLGLALLILFAAVRLIRQTAHILMEGTPDNLDLVALKTDLLSHVPSLSDVHHVHVWLLTSERPLMTLHVTVKNIGDSALALQAVKQRLREAHGISHSTVQIETAGCVDSH